MIEPDDYEMTKHLADAILSGVSESDLKQMGYLTTESSRVCYQAALERPEYWSEMLLDTEAAGCSSEVSPEWLERNKDWFTPL